MSETSVFSPVSDTAAARIQLLYQNGSVFDVLSVKISSLASSLGVWYTLQYMHMTDGFNKCQRQASL